MLLKSLGFKAYHKMHAPALSVQLKKERLRRGNWYRFWTVEDWRRVAFLDESKINIWGSDGVEFYWNLRDRPLQRHHVIPTVKYGGGSLMVWGCMTSRGVGSIDDIYGKMNAADYINMLKTKLEESLHRWSIDGNDFIFQQDNDPKHTAKFTKAYLAEKKGHTVLYLVLPFADLNPIEHLWRHLKLKLAQYERKATSLHELWERVKVKWETFDEDVCCKYIDSMPARVDAVINAKRWKYQILIFFKIVSNCLYMDCFLSDKSWAIKLKFLHLNIFEEETCITDVGLSNLKSVVFSKTLKQFLKSLYFIEELQTVVAKLSFTPHENLIGLKLKD